MVTWSIRAKITLYLGALISLLTFGSPSGGLIDIPLSFFLKNQIHLDANELAAFKLIAGIPLYFSFAFGFVRDWDPFNFGDRGFLIGFGTTTSAIYLIFAFAPMSYTTLLWACIVLTTTFLFASAAQNGLTAALSQQYEMSGQISAAWNIFLIIPTVSAFLLGGFLSHSQEFARADNIAQKLFVACAFIMGAVACFGIWKPSFVFDNVLSTQRTEVTSQAIKRFFRHRPVYPALLAWLLWNFAPGATTPLQYYLQDTLKADDAQWGQWNAIFVASFAPTFLMFGVLCRHFELRTLLILGTIIAIPQMVPLMFVQSSTGALLAAIPIGLMGGLATAAYLDWIIRAAPRGLEGTTLMMSGTLYFIATRFGDFIGAQLYASYSGFAACVVAITGAYALILPLVLSTPTAELAVRDE
jgi:MFS_1 like family